MAEGSPHSRRSTWIWLGIFVLLAFGLRFAFSIGSGFDEGTGRYLFTGNDPYYHYHTLEQILDTGKHVTFDPAINYPGGNYNPNPPIYVWSAAPLAAALQAGGASDPIGLALNIMVAVWGALTVIPVYLLGRDLWSRRAGLWAAFLLAVSAPHIERTIAGYADHDAPTMFFITLAFAFMVKALLGIQQRTYVARWSQAAGRSAGLKAAWTENRRPILWSAMAGLALTATALTWKGYPYALAIMAIAAGLQLIIEHLRRRDATPVFLVYLVPMVLVTFLPWLLYYRSFPTFQDTTVVPSMYVLLGVVVAGLLFVPTRNLPSVLVIPAAALLAIIGALVLKFLVPDVWGAITTGLGYFRTSKLYSTIAEAQRPEIGSVAGRFGFFTFLLVFWGIGLTVRGAFRGQPAMTLVLVWALVALFMAFRASRFIMNAAPVFVLLIGATIVTVLGYAGWDELARRLRNRRGQGAGAYAGALTWRSVLGTLAVLLLLVLPTVWAGFDAATTRDFERENGLDNRWFGAFGIGYELKGGGWLQTMEHLATLDADTGSIADRPAFIAWWDYGHWAVGIGRHPTVADPFQNHYEVAGRILAAESEQEVVSYLNLLLLNTDWRKNGGRFSPDVQAVVAQYPGLERVGSVSGYDRELPIVRQSVQGDAVFTLYDQLQAATGNRMHYVGVDDRMWPRSYSDPGIFYAPVFLANKLPEDFVRTTLQTTTGLTFEQRQYALDERGNSYRLSNAEYVETNSGRVYEFVNGRLYPQGRTPLQGASEDSGLPLAAQPQIERTERFSRTFYARAFGGELTYPSMSTTGVPRGTPPGDGLLHFRAIQESATRLGERGQQFGLQANASVRHTVLLEYYRGVEVSGRVLDDAGAAMSGLQVTFVDGFGARHHAATTDANGTYTVVAPFSVDGDLRLEVRDGTDVLASDTSLQFSRDDARGLGPQAGPTITIPRGTLSGIAYRDLDGVAGFNATADQLLEDVRITAEGRTATTGEDGRFSLGTFQAGRVSLNATLAGYDTATQTAVVRAGEQVEVQVALRPTLAPVEIEVTADNETVARATIEVQGTRTTRATTNSTGVATVRLEPGTYTLRLNHTAEGADGREYVYTGTQQLTVEFGGEPVRVQMQVMRREA